MTRATLVRCRFVILLALMHSGTTGALAQPVALRVQSVSVQGTGESATVRIASTGELHPEIAMLAAPPRLVIDLPGAALAASLRNSYPHSGGVRALRVAMHTLADGRRAARIVVDLDESREYAATGGASELKIRLGPAAAPVLTSVPDLRLLQLAAYRPATAALGGLAMQGERVAGDRLPVPSSGLPAVATVAAVAPGTSLPAPGVVGAAPKHEAQPEIAYSRFAGSPISLNLREADLRDFFRMIHEVSGLNVVLEPNVKGTLTIVLDAVPWDQALDIVLKNNDLGLQREGNVLRIATSDAIKKEAENRKATQEAEAQAIGKINSTRYLSYAKAKEVAAVVKKFVSSRGDVIADDRTNAIIVNDIPGTMPAIDALVKQLDRKTQEVEIEARVVAATRSFARDIGTQLGFGFGNASTALGGASAVGNSPIQTPNLPKQYITNGTNQIPLFSNLGVTSPTSGLSLLTATTGYQVDVILTAAESAGLLKILSRPRVVTQDNIQAVVKQGVRVPIVTQAQLNGPPTVNYVDAFLRLTVTPQITSEGTIFLNVDVENTTPDFGHTVQGNPSLITQQATTQILVTDGGTVVIGGVIQTTNSVNTSQVPLLGDIPVLGNLFKRRSVSTSNQELIFFITPKIIQT